MKRRRVIAAILASALAYWLLMSYSTGDVAIEKKMKSIQSRLYKSKDISNSSRIIGKRLEKRKLRVLIVTYMRSGSTFVGSMFRASSDVFYVFEPLHARSVSMTGIQHYLNGTIHGRNYEDDIQESINHVFDCRLQSLSVETLRDFFWYRSSNGIQYHKCKGKNPSIQTITDCLPNLTKPCLFRNTTVIKTIRYPMRIVERMIQKDQSLKVIHLIRDPRPTLLSHLKWNYTKSEDLDTYSHDHCSRVQEDVLITKTLLATYPDNIKRVFYEDITVDTLTVVRDLYKFLGIPFTEDVRNLIINLRSAEEVNCFACTRRSNVMHQLLKWRESIKYTDVEVIDRNCNNVYRHLGYLPANDETILRNLTWPLRIAMPQVL